jgi:tRNA-2-methylthio-N6-dimethylallyladenosine synthase
MKYFIKTFGCQANKSDSERIAGDYTSRGYKPALSWKQADEIVINTCSVRQRAEDRVVGLLKLIADYFKGKNRPKIILTGCMLHYGADKLRRRLPIVDEILSINEVGFNSPSIREDKTNAWVSISSGCNSFCSFCIVPYSRGREISRPMVDIIKEVTELSQNGYQEITLLGQNVNSFGLENLNIAFRKINKKSNTKKPPFVKLLQEVSKIKNIKKINFFTSNPWDFWDELIEEIATNKKITRYIHLPVQSGSNKILKLMNRGYTNKDYLKLVEKIKTKISKVEIGTDIIVGFPGETEKDFNDTLNLVKKVGFSVAFVAQYSTRPGTAAEKLFKDSVPPQIKKQRFKILDNLINK